MTLQQLYFDKPLVDRIQTHLVRSGILDPVYRANGTRIDIIEADGILGMNTEAAMRQAGMTNSNLEAWIAELHAVNFAPVPFTDLCENENVKKIVEYCLSKGYYLSPHEKAFNVIYLEGVSYDKQSDTFTLNDNKVDEWNDLRLLVGVREGMWKIIACYVATTGPGRYYTDNPLNKDGCARIQFGQYKAWIMGVHNGSQPALQHCDAILVCRDLNKDGSREGDKVYQSYGTVNHHSTKKKGTPRVVGKYSAGCMVGMEWDDHILFLAQLRTDWRYMANKNYKFIATICDGKEVFGDD